MPSLTLVVPTLLVASTCQVLAREVRHALARGERALTLDFTRNAYTDRAGYVALVALGREARAAGGPLVLRNPPRQVMRSLSSSGLSAAFAMETDAAPERAVG
jgi:anti-anti-sigma regulatory factor